MTSSDTLNTEELSRYSQQIKLKNMGTEGQIKLKNARVLCVGAGGLGSPLLFYLAAAGVGTLGIIDHDVVSLDNLHRQILYQYADIGKTKVSVAKERLLALNPNIQINIYPEKLTAENADSLIKEYDIIAEGSDNFATRYLVNDTCFNLKKPYVSASINQFEGQCTVFLGNSGPCLRCLFPTPPPPPLIPDCRAGGVMGVLPGILGTLQASEIIKWILNLGKSLAGRFVAINIETMEFREFILKKDLTCKHHKELNHGHECNAKTHFISSA